MDREWDVVRDLQRALEWMVDQYLSSPDGSYRHLFMSAGEEACEVLARYFPDRWRLTADGVERLDAE